MVSPHGTEHIHVGALKTPMELIINGTHAFHKHNEPDGTADTLYRGDL